TIAAYVASERSGDTCFVFHLPLLLVRVVQIHICSGQLGILRDIILQLPVTTVRIEEGGRISPERCVERGISIVTEWVGSHERPANRVIRSRAKLDIPGSVRGPGAPCQARVSRSCQ